MRSRLLSLRLPREIPRPNGHGPVGILRGRASPPGHHALRQDMRLHRALFANWLEEMTSHHQRCLSYLVYLRRDSHIYLHEGCD